MSNYIFESMSASDAANFKAEDYLFFLNNSTTASSVAVMPAAAPANNTSNTADFGVTLTVGGKSLTFNATQLSDASNPSSDNNTSGSDHIIFNDGSALLIGHNNGDTDQLQSNSQPASGSGANATPATSAYIYALGGNDVISGGGGNDYLNGGAGSDTITAGDGNNHIYGNAASTTQGSADGADSIVAGAGSNYINGNAGADNITVGGTNSTPGATTSSGYNRVFGGGDNDTITVNGGMGSHAAVNGNQGNDTINDNSDGTNTLRGGQGNDTIYVNAKAHDVVMGDVGNDTIVVAGSQGHIVVATGGAGIDTFDFSATGAGASATLDATGAPSTAKTAMTYYQEITDFTQGTDHIVLATQPTGTTGVGHSATVFANVSDAETYAQTQLTGTTTVSALSVGTANDTYLFYHDGSTTTFGIIHLDNVSSQSISAASFSAVTA